jgi:FdhD protein
MVTENRKIHLISRKPNFSINQIKDELALDEPFCIFINDEYHVTLIATPDMGKELAVGYLLSEGIINSIQEIKSITFRGKDVFVSLLKDIDLRKISVDMMNLIVTACGTKPHVRETDIEIPEIVSDLKVTVDSVFGMIKKLNKKSEVHYRTRGTHAAMICSYDGAVMAFAEDVGRHNAVDKVIGAFALNSGDSSKCVLLSTGRQSGEMVQKASRGGFPIIVSITVPLISGVRIAESTGVTLVSLGLGKLKVYSCNERITLDKG